MEEQKSSTIKGYLLIATAGALWGTGGTLVSAMNSMGAPSSFISFLGNFLSLVPLMIILMVRSGKKGFYISKKGLMAATLMGIIGKGLFLLAYNQSISMVGVSTAAVLLYLSPIFTSIFSVLLFKTKLTKHQRMALLLNIIGCFLVVTKGNLSALNISFLGIILGIFAAIFYSLNIILGKIGTVDDDPLTMTFYMLVAGTVTLIIPGQAWNYTELLLNWDFMKIALLSMVLTTLLANAAHLAGLSRPVEPAVASIISSIELVVANMLAVVVLNEYMTIVGIIGIATILFSMILMNHTTLSYYIKNYNKAT